MLKRMINSARVEMTIAPIDPLLVKSGQATVAGVDMAFVRTYRFGEKEQPFIPGSSMKGMMRSHAEKICRSLKVDPVPVCLPYLKPGDENGPAEKRQASCGLRIDKYKKDRDIPTVPSTDIYSLSCPVCRLFGSHSAIGRLATSDAYLTKDFQKSFALEIRDGVAIDRFTGGAAKGAKYDLEVLTRGDFETVIEIRNFERWQIGLLGLLLRDMAEGQVRLGFGKSRGLGRFKATIDNFQVAYFGNKQDNLKGIGAICPENEKKAYGFYKEGANAPTLPEPARNGLRYNYDITKSWMELLEPAVGDLAAMIETVQWPRAIEAYCERR